MIKPKICPSCGNSYDPANLFCPLDSTPLRSSNDPGELIGEVVAGRYLVAGRLGVGGMGEVYRAQDVRLQRPVALKVLHASLAGDLDAVARFNREAANCSKINNPHVVQVHDFGETDDGLAYLTMELVSGRNLKAVIDSEAPLSRERVVRIVTQIASGLDAAHQLDCPVVHRDLKPENILLTQEQDGSDLVKVVDFGISKAMRDDSQRVTRTGLVAGTYEFMSPEQVTGGAVDQRSDVYALGLITFLLLTSKLPFPAQSPEHSMLLRLTERPKTLREMRPDIQWPNTVQRVIDRALARDPAERYGSAGQFARELTRALEPEGAPLIEAGRGKRVAVWVIAAVLVLTVGGGVLTLPKLLPSESAIVESPDASELPEGSVVLGTDSAEKTGTVVVIDTVPPGPEKTILKPPIPPQESQPKSADTLSRPQPPVTTGPRHRPTPRIATKPAPFPRDEPPSLERYETLLHPDMSPDSALLALWELNALVPRLNTARDSVEADLYRAEATALAGRPREACAILDRARARATELQRTKIELWVDQGLCPRSAWSSS